MLKSYYLTLTFRTVDEEFIGWRNCPFRLYTASVQLQYSEIN